MFECDYRAYPDLARARVGSGFGKNKINVQLPVINLRLSETELNQAIDYNLFVNERYDNWVHIWVTWISDLHPWGQEYPPKSGRVPDELPDLS